ncbi:MAG TPA: hypothetical protein VJX71_17740 [Methylomirabilota bacterium]|nr:hypothetical protein [Methylomirabilota bacterium]
MKTLILAVASLALLATYDRAAALLKCPQPDGSVITVPESMGCTTKPELERQRAEQAAESQRRQAEAEADIQRRQAEQASQRSTDFVRTSNACIEQINRTKRYRDRDENFKASARADGTVMTFGTDKDRFDYNACMEQRGHPLGFK